MQRLRRMLILASLVVAACSALSAAAHATYPGTNGKIAFSTDGDPNGSVEIFIVNPDGSGETQLTHGEFGHAGGPNWSPDGSKILFQGDTTGPSQLYVMNANGSGGHLLFADPDNDDFNAHYSPDGSKIAYSSCNPFGGCSIDVVKSDGTGGTTQLTNATWRAFDPSWSPDGTKIAFDSNQDGLLSAVWVMNANGSGQRRLTAAALEAGYPDWSPDGTHILFQDLCCQFGTNIWLMNADGSGQKQLTHMPNKHQDGFAHYSPDGKRIVLIADLNYSNGASDLYTMDANGKHLTAIVRDQPGVFFSDWGTSS
jgi:Tol biopolymer transport system component